MVRSFFLWVMSTSNFFSTSVTGVEEGVDDDGKEELEDMIELRLATVWALDPNDVREILDAEYDTPLSPRSEARWKLGVLELAQCVFCYLHVLFFDSVPCIRGHRPDDHSRTRPRSPLPIQQFREHATWLRTHEPSRVSQSLST